MKINQFFIQSDTKKLMVICAILMMLTACATATQPPASDTTPPPPPEATSGSVYEEGVPGGIIVNTVEIRAKVVDIDYASRKVTLMGPDGDQFTTKVGPDAVNFDQVQKGDILDVTLTEELVVFLGEDGAPPAEGSAGAVALNPKGAKPGGVIAATTQISASVLEIDTLNNTVTLKFSDGSTKILPVRNDIDLSQHKPGETVIFNVTEMIAISVKKP